MGRRPQNLPVLEVYERFLRYLMGRPGTRASTVRAYQARLEPLACGFGEAMAEDMSPELVRDAQEAMLAAHYKPSSARRSLLSMATAWAWAKRSRLVRRDWHPPPRLRGAVAERGLRTQKRPFTVRELSRLLANVPPPWDVPVHLLTECGARVGEVCAANVGDVGLDDYGHAWWTIRDSKSGRARRIPLLPDTLASLPRRTAPGPLFLSYRGDRRMTTSSLTKAVTRALDELGMRKVVHEGRKRVYDLDTHGLRRSWVYHSHLAGVPRIVRMEVTGHQVSGVHDGYARNAVSDADARSAIEVTRRWRGARMKDLATRQGQGVVSVGVPQKGPAKAPITKARMIEPDRKWTPLTLPSEGFAEVLRLFGGGPE